MDEAVTEWLEKAAHGEVLMANAPADKCVRRCLFDGHRFSQISRLINVGAAVNRDMVGEQL